MGDQGRLYQSCSGFVVMFSRLNKRRQLTAKLALLFSRKSLRSSSLLFHILNVTCWTASIHPATLAPDAAAASKMPSDESREHRGIAPFERDVPCTVKVACE
jgi:hypothetical protein